MASGVATSQGYSNKMVVGFNPSLDYKDAFLINQSSLTSTPVLFNNSNSGDLVSPMTGKMKSYYSVSTSFGKKKSKTLTSVCRDIKLLKKM